MCSCALLQLKESPGPARPQPLLYCQVLLCKWSQARMQVLAGHRLLAAPAPQPGQAPRTGCASSGSQSSEGAAEGLCSRGVLVPPH